MMLRNCNRNGNGNANAANINARNNKPGDKLPHPQKKGLIDQSQTSGEPKPKRANHVDISHGIAGFVMDSSKKNKSFTRRSNRIIEKNEAMKNVNSDLSTSNFRAKETSDKTVIDDPCTNYNFDADSANDPFSVSNYAADIFKYYKSREKIFKVDDYMREQKFINKDHRAALVDWMVELQETFELNHETLYLSVKLVDLYLSSVVVRMKKLQLIACAAIFIASKFDELYAPLIDDFIFVSQDLFKRNDLIEMEREMVRVVGFDLGCPLSYRYVRRYARVCKQDMVTLTLARFILETSLMFYEFVGVSESRVASAAYLLATRMKDSNATWSSVLVKYSGYQLNDVEPLSWKLNHMLHICARKTFRKLQIIHQKYSHENFLHVAAIPLLPDRFSISAPLEISEVLQ